MSPAPTGPGRPRKFVVNGRPATASRLLVLAAALLFSTGGAAIKATQLSSWQVAGFRSAVAAAALGLLVPAARRDWSWRVLLVGAAYAATMVLFVAATKLTTAANAIFLQSTAPLYMLLLGPWLLKERIRRGDLLLIVGLTAALSLFFLGSEPAAATAPNPRAGNQIAALSGLFWALTVSGLRWLERQGLTSMPAVMAGNCIAFLSCLPMALPVTAIAGRDVLAIGYLGVFQIGVAYLCLTRAVRRLPAFEVSTLLLSEPALNPLWTWLLHDERPSGWALAGGSLILGATLLNAYWRARQDRRVRTPRLKEPGLTTDGQKTEAS
jgi:drug/metabolite transporter, DME family